MIYFYTHKHIITLIDWYEELMTLTSWWLYLDDPVASVENHTLSNLRVSQTGSTIHLIGNETDDPIYVNTAFVSELEETDVWLGFVWCDIYVFVRFNVIYLFICN